MVHPLINLPGDTTHTSLSSMTVMVSLSKMGKFCYNGNDQYIQRVIYRIHITVVFIPTLNAVYCRKPPSKCIAVVKIHHTIVIIVYIINL